MMRRFSIIHDNKRLFRSSKVQERARTTGLYTLSGYLYQSCPAAKPVNVPIIILTDVLAFSAAEDIADSLACHAWISYCRHGYEGGASGNNGVLGIQGSGTTDFQTVQGSFMTLYISPCAYKYIDGSQPLWGLKPTKSIWIRWLSRPGVTFYWKRRCR